MTTSDHVRRVEEEREKTLQALKDIRAHISEFEQLLDRFEEKILARLDRLDGWIPGEEP